MRFLVLCNNTVKSQTLLLRQFPLSLNRWAANWYFSLSLNSIPDWDTMADRFYRRFYRPGVMKIEMLELIEAEEDRKSVV